LPENRRKAQLGICITTLGTSVTVLCLICLKLVDGRHQFYIWITQTDELDDEGWQRSYLILVLLWCELMVIYEVLLRQNQYKTCANSWQLEILFELYIKLAPGRLFDSYINMRESRIKIKDFEQMEQLTDSQLEQWSTEVNHLKSLRWDACARWSIIGVMISVFVVFVWGLVRYDVICCTLFDPQLILWVAFCVMFRSVQYPRSYCFRPLETICFYFSDIYVFIFVLLLPQLD